jgi:hypothetical protein
MKTLRWILMPVACVTVWFLAMVIGIIMLEIAESLCPDDQMVSGLCDAPWWGPVEKGVFCFSTGLSAVLVVLAGFFVAPAARVIVAWIAFGAGSIVALWMAAGGSVWAECVSAIAAGLLTSFLLMRPRRAPLPNDQGMGATVAGAKEGKH